MDCCNEMLALAASSAELLTLVPFCACSTLSSEPSPEQSFEPALQNSKQGQAIKFVSPLDFPFVTLIQSKVSRRPHREGAHVGDPEDRCRAGPAGGEGDNHQEEEQCWLGAGRRRPHWSCEVVASVRASEKTCVPVGLINYQSGIVMPVFIEVSRSSLRAG